MPAYLCHGFRWQRPSIRVFVVVQNLDDASPEWIIPAKSSQCILEAFYNIFSFLPFHAPPRPATNGSSALSEPSQHNTSPSDQDFLSQSWSTIKLLEEYDPLDLTAMSRPHAYVADYAVRVDLSVSIADEMRRYEERVRAEASSKGGGNPPVNLTGNAAKKPGWFEKLRDQLQRGEPIGWYVVVNGDEVRDWPDDPPAVAARSAAAKSPLAVAEEQRERFGRNYSERQEVYAGGGDGAWKPFVPEKELRGKKSVDMGAMRPKTPSKGGFRRLFGRGKGEETSPS